MASFYATYHLNAAWPTFIINFHQKTFEVYCEMSFPVPLPLLINRKCSFKQIFTIIFNFFLVQFPCLVLFSVRLFCLLFYSIRFSISTCELFSSQKKFRWVLRKVMSTGNIKQKFSQNVYILNLRPSPRKHWHIFSFRFTKLFQLCNFSYFYFNFYELRRSLPFHGIFSIFNNFLKLFRKSLFL